MPTKTKKYAKSKARKAVYKFAIPRPIGFRNIESGLPSRLVTTLKYGESIQLNSTFGVPDIHVFRANSCYDPDVTGSGHQPRGFDQLMTFYQQGRVLKAHCKATFVVVPATATPQMCSLRYDTNVGAIQNYEALEVVATKSLVLGSVTNAPTVGTLQSWVYPQSNLQKNAADIFTASADSLNQVYFILQSGPMYTSTSETVCNVNIEISYTVELWDRKDPGTS